MRNLVLALVALCLGLSLSSSAAAADRCRCTNGAVCTCEPGCDCQTGQDAIAGTEAHFASGLPFDLADDCADGTCSVRRSGQPVRNIVRAFAHADRPRIFRGRLFSRRPVRSFFGRVFGGCRGCQ